MKTSEKTTFEQKIRAFEDDPHSAEAVTDLSRAVAVSVLRKVRDPQAKAAAQRESVSDSGMSPAIMQLWRGLFADCAEIDNTQGRAAEAAQGVLTDGIDIAQAAAAALLAEAETPVEKVARLAKAAEAAEDRARRAAEAAQGKAENTPAASRARQAAEDAHRARRAAEAAAEAAQVAERTERGAGWMEETETRRTVKRRVLTVLDTERTDTRETEKTRIQWAYTETRKAIDNARAVKADPRCPFVYVDDLRETDGGELETVYIRAGRYADIGGYETDFNGAETFYTADMQSMREHAALLASMDLNARQAAALRLREQGLGYKAIAARLNMDRDNVKRVFRQIQEKARKVLAEAEAAQVAAEA